MKRVSKTKSGGMVTEQITFSEWTADQCKEKTGRTVGQWAEIFGARMVHDVRANKLTIDTLYALPHLNDVCRKYGLMWDDVEIVQVGIGGVSIDDDEARVIEAWANRPQRSRKVKTTFRGKNVEITGDLEKVTRFRIKETVYNETLKFHGPLA